MLDSASLMSDKAPRHKAKSTKYVKTVREKLPIMYIDCGKYDQLKTQTQSLHIRHVHDPLRNSV